MKKNGINRLIDLLNQFEEEKRGREVGMKIYSDYYGVLSRKYRRDEDYGLCSKEEINYIFSREYGFIQRLADNDKISHFEVDRKMIDSLWRYHGKETTINKVWNNLDKVLIVLLSISDTPIEDLVSYLK